jgi:hypothetical protein
MPLGKRDLFVLLCAQLMLAGIVAVPGEAASAPATCPPPAASAGGSSDAATLASRLPAPRRRILACVGSRPIIGATVDHWAAIARKGTGEVRHRSGKPHRASTKQTIREVMGFLIGADWVLGEAQQLGVEVPASRVLGAFERIRHEQFPKRREFRAFLKHSGQTVADLLLRVRLNLSSTAIQQRIVAGQTTEAGREQALSNFLVSFSVRWRAQTYCLPAFSVHDCAAVVAASL